eukprot:2631908-Heterocapsa_arctica.AAC.1
MGAFPPAPPGPARSAAALLRQDGAGLPADQTYTYTYIYKLILILILIISLISLAPKRVELNG